MDDLKYPEIDPNKKTAPDIWNARYAPASYVFGKDATPFVQERWPALKQGALLDVAMGEGRNAVFLAKQGFLVEGVDCSSRAIEKANQLAADENAAVAAKTQNLDFFLMPLMRYDSVVLTYFKPQARFFSEIRRGLVEGGTVLIEGYLVDELKQDKELTIEECYKRNELLPLLKDFQVLYYDELPSGDRHIVRAIALKKQL